MTATTDKKTLYIHIGHYKTGTTALQDFLSANAELLSTKKNINYSTVLRTFGKHSDLAFSIFKSMGVKYLMHNYNSPKPFEEMWEAVIKDAAESDCRSTVISSEEFIRICEFEDSKRYLEKIAAIADQYDVKVVVICFLRDVVSHVKSWYNQLLKMRLHPTVSVNANIPPIKYAWDFIDRVHFDYELALSGWIDAFGKGNVKVLPYYGKNKEPSYIFEQFLGLFRLKLTNEYYVHPEDPNKRMDDTALQLLSTCLRLGFGTGTETTVRKQYEAFKERVYPTYSRNKNYIRKASENSAPWVTEQFSSDDLQLDCNPSELLDINEADASQKLNNFLFSELVNLRRSFNDYKRDTNKLIADATSRIGDLEKLLESTKGK